MPSSRRLGTASRSAWAFSAVIPSSRALSLSGKRKDRWLPAAPDHETLAIDVDRDTRAALELRQFRHEAGDPQRQAVAPLLDFRFYAHVSLRPVKENECIQCNHFTRRIITGYSLIRCIRSRHLFLKLFNHEQFRSTVVAGVSSTTFVPGKIACILIVCGPRARPVEPLKLASHAAYTLSRPTLSQLLPPGTVAQRVLVGCHERPPSINVR